MGYLHFGGLGVFRHILPSGDVIHGYQVRFVLGVLMYRQGMFVLGLVGYNWMGKEVVSACTWHVLILCFRTTGSVAHIDIDRQCSARFNASFAISLLLHSSRAKTVGRLGGKTRGHSGTDHHSTSLFRLTTTTDELMVED